MTKRILTIWLPLAALLTGCQTQLPLGATVPPQASTSVRSVAPAVAPRVLDDAQVRRLMQVAGTASLWGASYSQSYSSGIRKAGPSSNWWYESYSSFSGNAAFSGKSELLRVAYNRYVYRVPSDQVLVLNTVEGQGTVYLNGHAVGAAQPRRIHYLFGPGEMVLLNFAPVQSGSSRWDARKQVYSLSVSYFPLAVSGFTVSPSLLGGTGALGGAK